MSNGSNHRITSDGNESEVAADLKKELSAELHKSGRTIEIWVKAGYISCIKVGHSVFFDRNQVLADLRRFQIGGAASR